uniref:G-protein coupled receptors family 1 profile domain-containing protein n=1 Tax=Meloidogyne incognita TaxID=6306 RepID=A0A914LIE3_MELIC
MKPNFKRYLYMFSIVLIIGLFYNLIIIFYVMQYIGGGIKQFDAEYLNKTLPFVITKSEDLSSLIMTLIAILPFIIIFICGFKMVHYVNLHTGFDQNMKRLLKQLTKTLILLAIIPSINQFLTLLAVFLGFIYKTNDSTKENINIFNIFMVIFQHFTPVFNPIVCILTNKPYKEAVFNRLRIHPQ